jgi:toxin-antitoxin system PIN domain toxin
MTVSLLDVNVLMALSWPTHVHHDAAHRWLAAEPQRQWATCAHTQLAFLRLSLQPAVVKAVIGFADALKALETSTASKQHSFWALDFPCAAIADEIRSRLAGHNQLADALLLQLAIHKGGILATFDRRIAALLPPDSPNRSAVELIPV